MDHRITKQDVTGWACTCGAGEDYEVERDEFTGSPRNVNARTEQAERAADRHLAEMQGDYPVLCHRCGIEIGRQDAVYALENPNAAQDQRENMLCPVCDEVGVPQ